MVDFDTGLPPELREVLNSRGYFSVDDVLQEICRKVLQAVGSDLSEVDDHALDQDMIMRIASIVPQSEILQSLGTHIEHFGGIDQAIDFIASQIVMVMGVDNDQSLSLLEDDEANFDDPEVKMKVLKDQFSSAIQMCGMTIQNMEMFCDDPQIAEEYRQKNRDLISEIKSIGSVENLISKCGGIDQAMEFLMSKMSKSMPPSDAEPDIFDAVEDGDVEKLKELLKHQDVNQHFGKFDMTPLYGAITSPEPSFEVINLLLDHGADPRLGLTNTNVLHGFGFGYYQDDQLEAVTQVVQRCVDLGADLEQRSDRLIWTPLMTAMNEMNMAATVALLRAGANPNARAGVNAGAFTDGKNCLEMAISPEFVKVLLEFGADPTAKNVQGLSAIDYFKSLVEETTSKQYREEYSKSLDLMLGAGCRH